MRSKFTMLMVLAMIICQAAIAQELTGTILKGGKPQKGVPVWLKNGRTSTYTNKEGNFTLSNAQPDDTLQISVSSKYDAKVLVGELKNITVSFEKENFTLNDGTNEVQLPYSIVPPVKRGSVITHEMIMRSGMKTVADVVRRFVPGAQEVRTQSGDRFLSITRGNNSMRGVEPPLYVVDDVPFEVNSPDEIVAVEDIATLSVDRDGTTWGSRGANGVVIITTLRGN